MGTGVGNREVALVEVKDFLRLLGLGLVFLFVFLVFLFVALDFLFVFVLRSGLLLLLRLLLFYFGWFSLELLG